MLFEQREAMFALGFTVFGHGHFLGMVAILRHVTTKTPTAGQAARNHDVCALALDSAQVGTLISGNFPNASCNGP